MTGPLLSGAVVPEGIDWCVSVIHPSEMFWRQLRFGEFDVSEMSLSSLSIAAAQGVRDWVAIPVFTTRRFFHTGIVVRSDSEIHAPAELVGKRVGVPEYQQTAAVWARGALTHEFGVSPDRLRWFMERPPSRSHGGATAFQPPHGIDLSYIATSTSIAEMLAEGTLDASLVNITDSNLVDRRRADRVRNDNAIRPLFPDPVAEGVRYFRKTGLLPVNHVVVARASLVAKHPWIVLNIYAAFVEAKRVAFGQLAPAVSRRDGLLQPWVRIGAVPDSTVEQIREVDPLPYGLVEQREVLDTLADYQVEQGLVAGNVRIEDLFAQQTRDL